MKSVLAMMLMVGCGSVVELDPATSETSAIGSMLPLCGEMSCSLVACFASPDGGRPLCYCGFSSDPAYRSDEPVSCSCWDRIPDDYAGQTGCAYTSTEQ